MLHEQTEERKPTKLKTYTVRLDYEDCRFLTIRAASEEEVYKIVDAGLDDPRFAAAFDDGEPDCAYVGCEVVREEEEEPLGQTEERKPDTVEWVYLASILDYSDDEGLHENTGLLELNRTRERAEAALRRALSRAWKRCMDGAAMPEDIDEATRRLDEEGHVKLSIEWVPLYG